MEREAKRQKKDRWTMGGSLEIDVNLDHWSLTGDEVIDIFVDILRLWILKPIPNPQMW